MIKSDFKIEHTKYAKGIAIILMIIHHLFWNFPNIGPKIGTLAISQRVGIIGKVCVSMFLFLSGYGLYVSYRKKENNKGFIKNKLIKLYKNYLFMVITSFIISMIFFYDKFIELLPLKVSNLKNIILNFTGIQYYFGYKGLNAAWWFMSIIFTYYILFPILNPLVRRFKLKFLLVFILFSFINFIKLDGSKIFEILSWGLPFVLGMYFCEVNLFEKIKRLCEAHKVNKVILSLLLIFSLYFRQRIKPQGDWSLKFDSVLAILIIVFIYVFFERLKLSKRIVCYLGEKSMNIYYVHMFVTHYYMKEIIYSSNNIFIMVILTLFISIIWSESLDVLKKCINLNFGGK